MNKYQYKVQGVDYEVEITEIEGNIAKVNVNGIHFDVELKKPINTLNNHKANNVKVAQKESATSVQPPVAQPVTSQQVAQPAPSATPTTGNQLKAPLPGTITDIKVSVGQQVNVGDTVLILEAMKMQNNIEAEYAGTVTSITVKTGEAVKEGQVLIVIG